MLFHQVYFFAGDDAVNRQDVVAPAPATLETAARYNGNLRQSADLGATFETTAVKGNVICYNRLGVMICQYEMTDIVGAACLYLAGKMPAVEQKHCAIFQKACLDFSGQWKMPQPPMEFVPRPLFFYVLFNLDGGDVWKSSAGELIQRANGIGTAFLEQLDKPTRA